MQFTLDVIVRARAFLAVTGPPGAANVRLAVPDLYKTLDALLATLTGNDVVRSLADLAGIDPIVVPQPGTLFFQTGPDVGSYCTRMGLHLSKVQAHRTALRFLPTLDSTSPTQQSGRRSLTTGW